MKNINILIGEIENRFGVEVLYACETGSRAWGFPSPDSDYDIRFVYRHPRDWYLALHLQKDTIEFMDGELDITGWDLRKCLRLLKKTNVPLIERFQSPVVYYANEDFREGFAELIKTYYSPIAAFYHHYSLAGKFWNDMKTRDEISLKSYFYLVRSLLSCNWIARDATVLPMHMAGLIKYVDENDKSMLEDLIRIKASVGEKYLHPKTVPMQEMVLRYFDFLEQSKNNLQVNDQNYTALNDFFLKTLKEGYDD